VMCSLALLKWIPFLYLELQKSTSQISLDLRTPESLFSHYTKKVLISLAVKKVELI
jgi:hypothetical protein